MGLNGDMATAFMLFFIKSKIDFQILARIFRGCQKKVVILQTESFRANSQKQIE